MNNQIDTQSLIDFLLNQQKQIESEIDLKTAYKLFFNHLAVHNRPGTIHAYKCILKPLYEYFEIYNIKSSKDLNNDFINKYILYRKPLVKPQTINKEIIALKIMLNVMIKSNYIDKIHFSFERLKPIKEPIPTITKDSINKIINYFNNHKIESKYKLIFYLILTTGIRTTECINIKNKFIDLKSNTIYLEHTKNGESRFIYIVDDIKELLISVMSSNEYLFNDEKNNQMTSNNLRKFFQHLKSKLNIDVLSPHKLRHYYATTIYNNSLDVYLVKELLGHKSIEMTQIYLDIDKHNNQIKNTVYSPLKDLDPLTN